MTIETKLFMKEHKKKPEQDPAFDGFIIQWSALLAKSVKRNLSGRCLDSVN